MIFQEDETIELEEKVLEAVKKHGAVMRKDVEEASGLRQTAAGRLLKKNAGKGSAYSKGPWKKHKLYAAA